MLRIALTVLYQTFIKPVGLGNTSPVKYIVDLPSHIRSQTQELPIDPVQNSL